MPFFSFVFGLLVNIFWAVAISYGAALVSNLFAKEPDDRGDKIGSYPIEYSQKGTPIPKLYGCDRLAGNIIWHGNKSSFVKKTHQPDVDGHVPITTYTRDFSIGICEGAGFIQKIWLEKLLLWSSDGTVHLNNDTQLLTVQQAPSSAPGSVALGTITLSNGDGSQDMRWYTGEDLGAYKDLIWAHFKHVQLGPIDRIPNFSFEVSSVPASYKYTYISENGVVWGIPVWGTSLLTFDAGGVARDVGGGIVGLPMTGHPFVAGDVLQIQGTTNYDGAQTLTSDSSGDEIQFASAYNAETLDGTETVMKTFASLTSGAGRMAQDAAGNLYYAHSWDAGNSTYVTKIAPDGTKNYSYLSAPAWPINADNVTSTATDIVISKDGLTLWVVIQYRSGATIKHWLEKYDLTDGSNDWSVDAQFGSCFAIDVDEDNNCYAIESSVGLLGWDVAKFEPDAGVRVDFADSRGGFMIDVNSPAVDVVLSAGVESEVTDTVNNLYVATLTDSSRAKMAVGGSFFAAGLWNTYRIANKGAFVHDNGFIYVMSFTPTCTLYKIRIDRSGNNIAGLTEVLNVPGPTHGVGIYLDRWNNIAVLNQDNGATETDLIYYYDENLTFISKIDGLFPALRNWDVTGWARGSISPYPFGVTGCGDENPATIIEDLAEQNRYGAGIDSAYLNAMSIATERAYFANQNQLISLVLSRQMPLMDWVDFILSHCNGFRYWSEGQLHIGAFKNEASIASLDQDDFVRDEGDNPPPAVQIVKRKSSERSNRVEIQWVDRANTYDTSVAMAKDDVDQRVSGKVAIRNIELSGIKNATYAQNQAFRILFDSMYRFSTYAFKVSYKNMLLQVGDVIDISDGHLLTSQRCRIMSREEDKDGRFITIEAMEDIAGLYPTWLYVTQQTEAPTLPQIGSDDLVEGILSYREDPHLPRSYLFFAPGDTNSTGALVYRSYDGVNYVFIGRAVIDQTTPANAAGALVTSTMLDATTVVHRPNESFTVNIGTYANLRTDVSDAEFFGSQNLCKIGNEIIAWRTAEDQGGGIWKVSNLIRCIDGSVGSAHGLGELFATTSLVDVFYDISAESPGTTLYFKALPSSNIASMTLSQVSATVIPVEAQYARPWPMSLQRIRGQEGFQMIQGYPINVDFNLPSKIAGYNMGGYGQIPWGHFVRDTRLSAVQVKLLKMDRTEISESLFDLAGYQFGDYHLDVLNADRSGNDPIIIQVTPVAALVATKKNEVVVEIV